MEARQEVALVAIVVALEVVLPVVAWQSSHNGFSSCRQQCGPRLDDILRVAFGLGAQRPCGSVGADEAVFSQLACLARPCGGTLPRCVWANFGRTMGKSPKTGASE